MDVRLLVSGVVLATVMVTGSRAQMDVCGTAPLNSRILGPGDASVGEWPWQVSLYVDGDLTCEGTLINNQWVLTAAHCVSGMAASTFQVYLGRLSFQHPTPNEILRQVQRFIVHPQFSKRSKSNDIALLELDSPVTFNNHTRPVCLAADGSRVEAGTDCWLTGWGRATSSVGQNLQEVNIPVVSNNDCNRVYGKITSNHICAHSPLDPGPCIGDGGGPLLEKYGDRWVQVGVMSFFFNFFCETPGGPDGYTRVSGYQSWIQSHTSPSAPGFVYAGTSPLVSLPLPLLFAVPFFVLSLFQL